MLDLGLSELIVILAVALIVLGPKKLPELARNLGRGLAQFRRASEDLRRSILLGEETERLDNASKPHGSLSPLENQKDSPNKTKSPDTYDTYSPMATSETEEAAAEIEKQGKAPAAEESKKPAKRPDGGDED